MSFALAAFIIGVIAVAGAVWHHRFGGYLPPSYRERSCQGAAWRQAFPSAAKKEIRRFLTVFTESFGFRSAQGLQVRPNDTVFGVYTALYPRGGGIDGLELETLALRVERIYRLPFTSIWRTDLTFGQLFAATQGAPGARDEGDA